MPPHPSSCRIRSSVAVRTAAAVDSYRLSQSDESRACHPNCCDHRVSRHCLRRLECRSRARNPDNGVRRTRHTQTTGGPATRNWRSTATLTTHGIRSWGRRSMNTCRRGRIRARWRSLFGDSTGSASRSTWWLRRSGRKIERERLSSAVRIAESSCSHCSADD